MILHDQYSTLKEHQLNVISTKHSLYTYLPFSQQQMHYLYNRINFLHNQKVLEIPMVKLKQKNIKIHSHT